MTQPDTALAFPTLRGHQYANLTTFRKTGKAVVTPIWFAEENGKLYVMTERNSGKIKRIRNNPQILLAPCTARGKPLGPEVPAVARILSDAEGEVANQALDRKYGWIKKGFEFFLKLRRVVTERVYLEITPLDAV